MKLIQFLAVILAFISLTSCEPTKKTSKSKDNANLVAYSASHWMDTSAVFSKSFTGFALYDPDFKAFIDSLNYDKYFTPASNTKILTCYGSMKALGKNISALRYVISGDSLIFWGVGDPSLLHPRLDKDATVIEFLKGRKEKLFYAPQEIKARFGEGWAWDDYNYGFSPERSDLPIHGNYTVWKFEKGTTKPSSQPDYFNQFAVEVDANRNGLSISRDEHQNIFRFTNPKKELTSGRSIPFTVNTPTTKNLLSNATGKVISITKYYPSLEQRKNIQTVYSLPIDRLLEEVMKNSDNMVAEQLLLNISYEQFKTLDTDKAIQYISDKYLKDTPDKLVWKDGSGVSRYNLFTPRTMIYVLEKMRTDFGEERLFKIFAAGGVSGTIKDWYGGENTPYVYAKTGTLSNQHSLSGYIKTKSGKTLLFSFMHNNFITESKPLKVEMEKVLKRIYEEY